MDPETDIPLPRYNLGRIEKLRKQLLNDTFIEYYGLVLDSDWWPSLARDIKRAIGGKLCPAVLEDSLRTVMGIAFTEEVARQLAWRLAGNLDRLREAEPVHPWIRQYAEEWVPVEVLEGVSGRDMRERLGATFTLQILAGSACPIVVSKFWTMRLVHYMSRRLGFSAPWGSMPMGHIIEIVKLRFFVLLTPERSRDAPGFEHLSCPSSLVKYNQHIIGMRRRLDWQCPSGYTHHCFQCAVGYDECPAGTHPTTLYELPASPAALS